MSTGTRLANGLDDGASGVDRPLVMHRVANRRCSSTRSVEKTTRQERWHNRRPHLTLPNTAEFLTQTAENEIVHNSGTTRPIFKILVPPEPPQRPANFGVKFGPFPDFRKVTVSEMPGKSEAGVSVVLVGCVIPPIQCIHCTVYSVYSVYIYSVKMVSNQ